MRPFYRVIVGAVGVFCGTTHALADSVDFAEHIAPIIFENCVECHRPGEAAPFSLTTYASVRKRAKTIRAVTQEGYMPPWHPVEGHGSFRDSRRLSVAELALIDRWVESGMKEGDPKKMPELPEFPGGWRLGEPDLIVKMPKAYTVPAGGPDIYRNFVIPLNLDTDKWVAGVEIRPSARAVVHHSLFFLDNTGAARKLDGRDGTPGFKKMGFPRSGDLGGWAIGATPRLWDEGLALPLKKGSDLVLSTHFHPSGKVEHEQTSLAIYFAKKPPRRVPVELQIPPDYGRHAGLNIPAGAKDFSVQSTFVAPVDLEIVTIGAHAHYLGKSMRSWATAPDGRVERLFRIDDWDFNWQGNYQYEKPVRIPKGTKLSGVVTFDNSADNPNNQFDPPRQIRWGLESTDEMGSIIMRVVPADPKEATALQRGISAYNRAAKKGGQAARANAQGKPGEKGVSLLAQLRKLDKNRDGVIEDKEMPAAHKARILQLDKNGNGRIERAEAVSLIKKRGNK